MKLFKQITCAVLTLCLCAGLLLIPSAPVSAATGPSAPKAVDVSYYKNYPMVNDSAISVQLGTNGKNIKNIKTSSKNLKAKVTRLSLSSSSNSGYVGVYAKKTGKYTVSFDVYNAQNKKIKKFTVKVNVKMNKGYKLKKIEYSTYSKPVAKTNSSYSTTYSNSEITKKVKNGKSIQLGHYGYYYGHDYSYAYGTYSYESYSRDGDIMAPTIVKITYLDKNKNTISTSYTLYRIADDVK